MKTCNAYINESSLMGTMPVNDWEDNVLSTLKCIDEVCSADCNAVLYMIRDIYQNTLLQDGTKFDAAMKHSGKRDFVVQFHHKTKTCIDWRHSPLASSTTEYETGGNKYKNSSIGEAYENNNNDFSVLLNIPFSAISEPLSTIVKAGEAVTVISVSSPDKLNAQLRGLGLKTLVYDTSSIMAPRDEETFLRDSSIYEPTKETYHGRIIYKKKDADELYYVDSMHHGNDAHIEIFSSVTRKQIAISRVDKVDFFRDLTDKERKRKLITKINH